MAEETMSNSAVLWLLIWTLNNLGVTLINKAAFSTVDFHYPFVLSAIHMACNLAGASWIFYVLRQNNNKRGIGKSSSSSLVDLEHSNGSSSSRHSLSSTHSHDSDHSHSKPQPSSDHPQQPQQHWLLRLLGDTLQHRQHLDAASRRRIAAFSVLFSLNIAIGNWSLRHVSVNFNQVLRSLVPALTMVLGMMLGQHFSPKRQRAVGPIIAGVAMACFGDMSYTATGLLLTVLCVLLAALKVVASGELLTGGRHNSGHNLKLHPVDLLGHMAPLALVQCLFLALLKGELHSIAARWDAELSPWTDPYPLAVVLLSGVLSFSLNISSLQANKLTSPLTLCIAANVKQVLMIGASTLMFGTVISPLNGAGIAVVLMGSARYSYISVMEKQKQQQQAKTSPPHRILKEKQSDVEEHSLMMVGDIGVSSSSNGGVAVARPVTIPI